MYIVKMINGDSFKIKDDTFNSLAGKSGLILISELGGIINLTSVASILPEEIAESTGNRRRLHDGTYAVYKSGNWVDEKDNTVKINLAYYPELLKDIPGGATLLK